MSVNRPFAGLVLALLAAPTLWADKLDTDSKKWLEGVRPILLPEEERIYKGLKDKAERQEFQKIFWARRDPDLETPANEYQIEYEKARTEADAKFKVGGTAGSLTDCGRVFILLGPPDDTKKNERGERPGRTPETWTFKDRPSLTFKGGQIQIDFDENCLLPQGARLGDQLNRVAEGKLVSPNLNYRPGTDGRVAKLVDQLPKPTPIMALLKAPRQDFATAAESTLFLRSPGGATYMAGLLRLEPGTVTAQDVAGKKLAKASVGIQALTEGGKVAASAERVVSGELQSDGAFVVSYGVALKPGSYTLKVGALDPKTEKGSVASQPLTMPDFGTEELTLSPVVVLHDIQEQPPNNEDPLAAFQLGNMRFVPRYGNVFTTADAITILTFIYNAKTDEAGRAAATVSIVILKDGKPVARAEDQVFETPDAGPSVGPVPLKDYKPGKYVAQIKVRDNIAKKDHTQETFFEVR